MRVAARSLSRLPTGWLVTLFLLLTGLPILVLAYVSLSLGGSAVREEADARVADTAAISANLVQEELGGVQDLVQSYATRPDLIRGMGGGDPGRYDLQTLNNHLIQLRLAQRGTAATFITDPGGRLIDIVPATPGIVSRPRGHREPFRP